MQQIGYRSMTRSQLATFAGVCLATFNKWIRQDLPALKKRGYQPRSLLNPSVVKYLCEKYCIEV
ncbi:MAG: hypothetical protein K5685_06590 [Bacteroidales bacterium]|nr:hypothetical protein [Bacteroidales bacterium]